MTRHPRVAAAVVLYHPDSEVTGCIRSYLDNVARVYVVDNTEGSAPPGPEWVQSDDRIVYLPNGDNLGVATALNIAARKALEDGFDKLLTMDQDSRAGPGMVGFLVKASATYPGPVAIAGPAVHTVGGRIRGPKGRVREVMALITSGSLLDLSAYEQAGPFMDELFVDWVDTEYCLRMKRLGCKVLGVPEAVLIHALGSITRHRFVNKVYEVTNHSSIRRYYMTRNRMYVTDMYMGLFPRFCVEKRKAMLRDWRKMVLFESDRISKIWMICRGYLDYKRGRLGKLGGTTRKR